MASQPSAELKRDPRFAVAAELLRAGDRDGAKDFYVDILNDKPDDARAAAALARIGVASRDIAILRVVIKHASALDRPILASCVGQLLVPGRLTR
ncbi:MAG: hypothetical protein HC869_27255 [Rhodospirillales bacterium]|nr:hypothetical protein [Rhodospirillales bacterium]